MLNYWAPDGCLNYWWPQPQRGEKTHANDSSGEGVGQEGVLGIDSLLWLYSDFPGVTEVCATLCPPRGRGQLWSLAQKHFLPPLSGSRLLLLQTSAQKPQVLKKPALTSLMDPLTTLGVSPSKHRPRFTVFSLCFCRLVNWKYQEARTCACSAYNMIRFAQYLAQSRCSICNRLTAYNRNVCVCLHCMNSSVHTDATPSHPNICTHIVSFQALISPL